MQHKHTLSIVCIFIIVAFMKTAQADGFYSVTSLKTLCGNENPWHDDACKAYLHGVVETWMMKDMVSVEPYRYRASKSTFCETINKVSDNEWLKIVRDNLNSMGTGFASDAVMTVLSKQLCK